MGVEEVSTLQSAQSLYNFSMSKSSRASVTVVQLSGRFLFVIPLASLTAVDAFDSLISTTWYWCCAGGMFPQCLHLDSRR